ncbi:type III secretion system inner rod subunit SctI [Pseudomonas typographi]|uniref:type III secretion system inner rod subunit SctI n=1 Tax=Pseudomonas typographi TaxID=2715964 RepID=UPI001688FBBA|nr:type III secretion system inner rod subunit SctI [Pseudomonas typographi]MBD1554540.1 type III secretion system inner rod subunit SctI [Pseudomonas typographi]
MTITSVGKSKEPKAELDQGLVHEPSQADVDLFSTALRAAEVVAPAAPIPAALAGALADRVQATDKLSQQAMRNMKAAVATEDPTDITQMSRALSTYSLQTAVTTKVVNKTAQTLDKLTNLQ